MYQKQNSSKSDFQSRPGNPSESGQVLVILMLAIVGLLAFAALAIDGGMIYADRRGGQNAADSAVLASGFRIANSLEDYNMGNNIDYTTWDCNDVAGIFNDFAQLEAIQHAVQNGYEITSGEDSITLDCETGIDYGTYMDKYADTIAQITSPVKTSFVHFAFGGQVKNTIDAISRVRPRIPLAFGYAIYAHGDGCGVGGSTPGGVTISGTPDSHIYGGGVLSASCLTGNGGAALTVHDGQEIIYGTSYNGGGNISPAPTLNNTPLPDWSLVFSEPDCDGLTSQSSNGNGTITRGIYNGITVNGTSALVMEPGLYCLDGDFRVTSNNASVIANGVTIYMRSGDFLVNGGDVTFSSPTYVSTAEDGIAGMFIYVAENSAGDVTLAGNGGSVYTGVVYAPNAGSIIDTNGTADTVFNCQLIAAAVRVTGNATFNVNFINDLVYKLPARLTLEK